MNIEFFKSMWPYIRAYKGKVIGSILFSVGLALVKLSNAYLVKPIFDKGLSPNGTFQEALVLAGILLVLNLINFPFRFFHFYWLRYVVDRATCAVRSDMFNKMQKLPMSYFAGSKQGNLVSSLLNDTNVFSQGFRNGVDLLREPLSAFVMVGLAFYRDWQLSLVIVVTAPLFGAIFIKSGRKVRVSQGLVQQEMSEMTHNISEGIEGQKVAKAFNLRDYLDDRFQKAQRKFFKALMQTTFVEEFAHPLVEVVGALAFSLIIVFAHHRITTGAMTTGDFVSFVVALALVMDPIRKFSQANVKMNQAVAAGERIFELLRLPEERSEGEPKSAFNDKIEIKNVSFSYGQSVVLKDFSLTIKKGEKVALVGLSGSGKSTLINLLLSLYDHSAGDILIDGVPIKRIKLADLRQIFGLVSQDIFLFHDSIRENLTLGHAYSEAEIHEALRVAHAHDFVDRLSEGQMTTIGDRGTKLSGGERQRLTIARAFLRNSPVLLFDEATSALDNESEKIVQRALDRLSQNKTLIAVAHRLSSIQDFDQIYVLHQGKLIEKGTHRELMAMSGEYAKLYELGRMPASPL